MHPAQQLNVLLKQVRSLIPDREFCGVGIIVYANLKGLPIVSLCSSAKLPDVSSLAEQIALCSIGSSGCHDGFQLVSENWQLTKRNQYFAPFPEAGKRELASFGSNIGSRHMAAKLGSMLDHVICTGLVSDSDGLLVFLDGVAV